MCGSASRSAGAHMGREGQNGAPSPAAPAARLRPAQILQPSSPLKPQVRNSRWQLFQRIPTLAHSSCGAPK